LPTKVENQEYEILNLRIGQKKQAGPAEDIQARREEVKGKKMTLKLKNSISCQIRGNRNH
jgi:hypothetical protein